MYYVSTMYCSWQYEAGAKVWKSSFLAICKMQVPAHHVARCESGRAICTESKGSTLVSRGRALSPCTRPLLVPHWHITSLAFCLSMYSSLTSLPTSSSLAPHWIQLSLCLPMYKKNIARIANSVQVTV